MENQLTSENLAEQLTRDHISDMAERHRLCTFAELEHPFWKDEVVPHVMKWDFKNPLVCSIIQGHTGSGKSHLAFCLYKKFIYEWYLSKKDENYDIYLSMLGQKDDVPRLEYYRPSTKSIFETALLDEIKGTYDKNSEETTAELTNRLVNYDILLIDDIFSGKENEHTREKLFAILKQRFEWTDKPTILTSNLCFKDIGDREPRIASLINNVMLIPVPANVPDYRPRRNVT